ncbi:MAG: hypothetical protein Q4A15_07805, partial [Prevotellaceae bacterium]|nr:hypothetical protein [Prevotellaceae bacterium]
DLSDTDTVKVSRAASVAHAIAVGDISTITVPTTGAVTRSLTATVKDQYGDNYTNQTVAWSIPEITGVSIVDGEVGAKLLSVDSTAQAGTVTVTATYGSGESAITGTTTVTITREAPKATTIEIVGEITSIDIPATKPSAGENATASYTATVKDQFGAAMTGQNITWSIKKQGSQNSVNGVGIGTDGKVTVTSAASSSISNSDTFVITATVSGTNPAINSTKSITIKRADQVVT